MSFPFSASSRKIENNIYNEKKEDIIINIIDREKIKNNMSLKFNNKIYNNIPKGIVNFLIKNAVYFLHMNINILILSTLEISKNVETYNNFYNLYVNNLTEKNIIVDKEKLNFEIDIYTQKILQFLKNKDELLYLFF